jgi:ATP-dependent 26S proteasome regulatory subunit
MSFACHHLFVCRKDMLDEAMLRPGRLEVQMRVDAML